MANRNRKISQVVARTQAQQTRLRQHEGSANNGGGKMFPGLGKRLGGPLARRKPKR